MARKVLSFFALLLIPLVIYGCGQQAQQINNINNTPSNLSIKGTVYGMKNMEIFMDITIGDPISGAYVAISGSSGTWNTLTNAKGEYSFNGIPDGSYSLIVTAEGYEEPLYFFGVVGGAIKPSSGIPANDAMSIFNVNLYPWPIITGYSPVSGEVISNNQSFTITFNEVMDSSTVKVNLIPQGLRTFSPPTSAQVNLTWDGSGKILTVTPIGQLTSNECYKLEIFWAFDPVTGALTGPQDIQGEKLVTPYFLQMMHLPLETKACNNFALYRVTTGGSLPGTPSNLKISYFNGSIYTTEADAYDYWINLWTGSKIFLQWDSPTGGAPISGYNIYASNGSSKEYIKLNSTLINNNQYTTNTQAFEMAFWPTGLPWSDPVCGGNYPFINNPCRIKVVAFNGDGEGSGVEISVQDSVSPKITSAESAGSTFASLRLNNNYYLPAIQPLSSGEAYILLSEPVNPSTVSGNVTISGVTLTAALLTQSAGQLGIPWAINALSIIKLNAGMTNIRGMTVTIGSGLKDLAGNSPVAGSGDTIVLP